MRCPKLKTKEKIIGKGLLLRKELWFGLTANSSAEIIKGLDNGNEKTNWQGMIMLNIFCKKEGKICIYLEIKLKKLGAGLRTCCSSW